MSPRRPWRVEFRGRSTVTWRVWGTYETVDRAHEWCDRLHGYFGSAFEFRVAEADS